MNFTFLDSAPANLATAPRQLRLESQGSTHRVYFNSVLMITYTDANNTYSAGQPGIADSILDGLTVRILSFTGGDLAGTGEALNFITTALSSGTLGVDLTPQSLQVSGGSGSYTFAITAGALPAGLSLSSAGTISGTPTAGGTVTGIQVTATDTVTSLTAIETFSMTIAPATPTVELDATSDSIAYGTLETFFAYLPSAATGTVTFYNNGNIFLGSGTVSGGVATFSISTLAVGSYSITAAYSGDSNYSPATSSAESLSVSVPAAITSPAPGSTLTSASTTFTWSGGSAGTTGYYLHVGTSPGAADLVNIGPLSGTSATVNLPTDGATIYVELQTVINGSSLFNSYTYTEFTQ